MVTTTGPQRQVRPSDLVNAQSKVAKRRRMVAFWVAFVFLVAGVALIGLVVRDLSSPSVFMAGIASLIVAALAALLTVLLDMCRALMQVLGIILEQLGELRAKQDREHERVSRALWGQVRGGRDNG